MADERSSGVHAGGWPRRLALLSALAVALAGCSAPSLRLPGFGGDDAPAETPSPTLSAAGTPMPATATPVSMRPAQRIERISIEPSTPTTRVVLELDGFVEPEVSLLANHRLVLDLPGTTCATLPRLIESDDPLVARVRTGQHAAPEVKSRVVLDLRRRADFAVRSHARQVVVVLSAADAPAPADTPAGLVLLGPEGTSAPAAPEPATGAPSAVVTPAPDADARGEDEAAPPPEPQAATTAVPQPAATPAPAAAAEPSVTGATPSPSAAVAELGSPAPHAATPAPVAERISVDFIEADVRTVIELIARAGGYQVIFTPEVSGTVSLTLVDRPWEEALEVVLRAKRLREVRHEDVMLVSPASPRSR